MVKINEKATRQMEASERLMAAAFEDSEKILLLFTVDSYLIFKEVPLGLLFIGIVYYI